MGNIFSASSLIQVLGILAAPLLFRKLGIVSGVACSQLLAALLLGFLAATAGTLPAAVIYIVFTGFLWMGEPGMFSLLMGGVNPEERAGASALNFLVISFSASRGRSCNRRLLRPVRLSHCFVLMSVLVDFRQDAEKSSRLNNFSTLSITSHARESG
jgi:hypothetical protein